MMIDKKSDGSRFVGTAKSVKPLGKITRTEVKTWNADKKAIHLKCERLADGNLRGLKMIERPNVFRSVAWEISWTDAELLVGGWAYLHQTKAEPSHFGGKILRVEDAGSVTAHGTPEVALIVESRVDGKRQKWRGANHGMAWSGGLVDVGLDHEREASPGRE